VIVLPRFEEISVLTAIQRHKITWALVVPPVLIALLHSKNVPQFDLSSLRGILSGAAPLGADIIEALERRFPSMKITQGYGLTETTPVTHVMTEEEGQMHRGQVGRLIPTFQARLIDVKSGEDVAPGQPGELWLRGPSVMKGYWRNAEATSKAFAEGGWFKTGDVAIVDEHGYYTCVLLKPEAECMSLTHGNSIVDRVKELIKYKGFQGELTWPSRAEPQFLPPSLKRSSSPIQRSPTPP
jgi:acyl-CoA synthetase (AMP-forming)/AMP-acid ligase II